MTKCKSLTEIFSCFLKCSIPFQTGKNAAFRPSGSDACSDENIQDWKEIAGLERCSQQEEGRNWVHKTNNRK